MNFQASNLKGKNFLELLNNDSNPLELSIIKSKPWLQYFGHSNSLCTRTTRAIVNHAPIGEYQLKFFSIEEFTCPCGVYLIESSPLVICLCRGIAVILKMLLRVEWSS